MVQAILRSSRLEEAETKKKIREVNSMEKLIGMIDIRPDVSMGKLIDKIDDMRHDVRTARRYRQEGERLDLPPERSAFRRNSRIAGEARTVLLSGHGRTRVVNGRSGGKLDEAHRRCSPPAGREGVAGGRHRLLS